MVETLVRYAERIMEEGVEAVLASADLDKAKKAADADRAALLGEQGADANDAGTRVELIRKTVEGERPD